MDPAEVLSRLAGRATTADLLERTTRHLVRRAVADGSIVRAARGAYALPGLPSSEQAAARAHGVLSHTSAAAWWGLGLVLEPTEVHVTIPHGARAPVQPAVRLHRTNRTERKGPVTPVLRTVLDCATLLPFPEALAVADGALRLRFINRRELLAGAEATRGPGRARRLRVARMPTVAPTTRSNRACGASSSTPARPGSCPSWRSGPRVRWSTSTSGTPSGAS